jgi:phage-related protein
MADINKSILFTKFGAMTAKLTAAAAAVGLVAAGIAKLVKDAEQFGQAFAAVSTDMSEFNKNTSGLINTLDGLQGTVKLQEAGLALTAEQLGAIGSAAASMSQKLGEGPEGATTRFNKLVKAIVSREIWWATS